ncbi:hypothetical protein BDM02DRAFT_3088177 [Thelephora ganbajun]|uniref:Uncharacterized protein n=1 Tax=Thelephora ganbajun TaxID=370292 RepID=A0ACB6ZTU0_THEGA|nr:hypothetical protein BDM02DRAFT_3088177 [Thelephora ganbajun]
MTSEPPTLPLALFVVRVIAPALVFLSALSVIPTKASPSPPSPVTSVVVKSQVPRRGLILSFLTLSSFSYFSDGLTFVVYAVINKYWPPLTAVEISAVLGIIAYGGLAALGAYKDINGVNVWSFAFVKYAILLALLFDTALVVLLAAAFKSGLSEPFSLFRHLTIPTVLHIAFPAFRILLLIPLFFALHYPRAEFAPVENAEERETQPTASSFLIAPQPIRASAGLSLSAKYGTFSDRSLAPSSTPSTRAPTPVPQHAGPSKKKQKDEVTYNPSWSEFQQRLKNITPYLWPSRSRSLQAIAGVCILLLAVGRVVNVFLPLTLGKLVGVFEKDDGTSFWPYLLTYIGLRFLQSSGGIGALRDTLWGPVMQYSDRAMSQLAFDHLLNLSLSFHVRRKTGEVLRILDRGAAINRTLELILFNIIPTFVDIFIALILFAFIFDWTLAVVIAVAASAYILATVILTRWRTKLRRQMNDRDVITRGIHTDCLLNYETVKYFNGEHHEGERYRAALAEYQALEYRVIVSLNLLNLVQNLILTLGFLVGSIIVALRVTSGDSTASDFVIFIAYLVQLYEPLNMLASIYRSINTALVDTEKLLKLLNEPVDIKDKPNAPDLVVTNGEIEFDNVSFSYDDRVTSLDRVSFKVPKGSSVALVGESGSGKSTILRLLYRFYDLKEGQGRILIDGQDIRDVTQASLRKAIGVVPQDSILFNVNIKYNIGYGRLGASDEEIIAAAAAAQMHERILSFPDGYETKVGERGVRLSGGEKQRVAIARTLLKNPPILLLDEATSALDTSTEKDIQKALEDLAQGRTSLSIAHRLSTIATADQILVLKEGSVIERGSHAELLASNGTFAEMWNDQVSASDAASTVAKRRSVVAGYEVEQDTTTAQDVAENGDAAEYEANHSGIGANIKLAENDAPVDFPTTDNDQEVEEEPVKPKRGSVVEREPSQPVTFPTTVAFPGAGDAESRHTPSIANGSRPQSPGVTFEPQSPPSRNETPDPDAEPKRKRTASQNFQRLSRRISIGTRRAGSALAIPIQNIPGFKREGTSTSINKDEPVTDAPVTGSPPASLNDVAKARKIRKDKKEKRKTLG